MPPIAKDRSRSMKIRRSHNASNHEKLQPSDEDLCFLALPRVAHLASHLNPFFAAHALMKITWTPVHAIDALALICDGSDAATRPEKVSFRGDIVPHGTRNRVLPL